MTAAPAAATRPPSVHAADRWRLLVTATLLTALATLCVSTTLMLKQAGEEALEAQSDLQEIATMLHIMDGLEWRTISGRIPPDEAGAELDRVAAEVDVALQHVVADGVPGADAAALAAGVDIYHQGVTRELELIQLGLDTDAEEFDEGVVDPAFEAVQSRLAEMITQRQRDAARGDGLSDLTLIGTVIAAVVGSALVLWWRMRSDLRHVEEQRVGARYRALVDQSSDLVMVAEQTGQLTYLSPSARRFVSGLSLDGSRLHLSGIVHADDREAVQQALALLPTHGTAALLTGRLGARTTWRSFEIAVRNLTDDSAIGGLVLTAHDITERQHLQRELSHQARHDALTGLPNRTLLAERFEQALADAPRSTGLLLIDLDRFKEINDTLGHHIGDELLAQVGPRLADLVRGEHTVARLGGDEFAVLLRDVRSLDDVTRIAASVREALTKPFSVDSLELEIEASIGVVLSGQHGADAATLLQRADVAMYVAKARGIGVFSYDPSQDDHNRDRLSLLGDLRRAMHHGELVLHYQPQMCLKNRQIRGAEALVRWAHPVHGLLGPDTFIPLAEHTGLMGPLTHHILDMALAQVAAWQADGAPLQVSVNLSPRNLLDEQLDQRVQELLARHGVPAELLVLEVTESAIMSEPVRAVDVLNRLHRLGIRIAVDDFGAGYTSLAQLRDLPVHELKVDRSFVMSMVEDRSNQLIVRSVVDLGHNLGLRTVAEGVESAEALAAVSGYGCDFAQGYHLCRPLPIDEFDTWRAGLPSNTSRTDGVASVPQPRIAQHRADV